MSNNNNDRSMGEAFQRNRAAAVLGKQQSNDKDKDQSDNVSSNKPRSLLDIQAEQAREKRRNNNSPRRGISPRGHSPRGGGQTNNNTNNNNSNNNNNNRSKRGGRGSRATAGQNQQSKSEMPIEQGVICTLKDSFGFIHCADRPDEIFFHYSEVSGTHPDSLRIDDEVEFRVGNASNRSSASADKMAAYEVRTLLKGTIVWETEDSPGQRVKGLVDRQVRNDSRGAERERDGAPSTDGVIKLVEEVNDTNNNYNKNNDQSEENSLTENQQRSLKVIPNAPTVRFTAADFAPPKADANNTSAAASANATAAATAAATATSTSLRGPSRLMRGDLVEFSVFTDRRTKAKYARNITLIQSEKERTRLEKERKLLASATVEHGVVTSLKSDYGFIRSNSRTEEVFFHYSNMVVPDTEDEFVLKEGQDMKFLVVTEETSGEKLNCSARKLQVLPRGSVVFHETVQTAVTGVVFRSPQPPSNVGQPDDKPGIIRLSTPITVNNDDGSEQVIDEVNFRFSDCPGGDFTYQHRGASVIGVWIREGDTLLFDVVKELADGSFRAARTYFKEPKECKQGTGESDDDNDDNVEIEPAIRVLSLSPIGRAEGTIHSLKDSGGYGFIHYAERPVDVHFKLYDVLPDEIQLDLRKHIGVVDHSACKLDVGIDVQFDLSVHGMVSSTNSRGRHGRGGGHERENLKAQRILLLPPSTILQKKVIVEGAKAVVAKEDPKQTYAGYLDFEDEMELMSVEEQHPMICKMITDFLRESAEPKGRKSLVFHDLLGSKDDEVVTDLVDTLGEGKLVCTHVPVPGMASGSGRLCIRRVDENETAEPEIENEEATPSPKKNNSKNNNTALKKPLRFDKSSLVEEAKADIPPGVGDVVTCDLVQIRRTGKVLIQNMKIIERKSVPEGAAKDTTNSDKNVGIVKEVVTNRKFGFISILDENATKREVVFFNFSSVVHDVGSDPPSKKHPPVRKGDEVEFDIKTEQNGKRVALNVKIVPKGTIPSKAAKNACLGYILMEPTHTSLSDTPVRKHHSNSSSANNDKGGGRWANTKDDRKTNHPETIVEDGCILLLEDPSGMFSKGKSSGHRSRDTSPMREGSDGESKAVDGKELGKSLSSSDSINSFIETHLSYKNGALAIHGTGSSSVMDESSNPKRGDLVSFVKAKSGKGLRDIRVVTRQAATLIRGRLENIKLYESDDGDGDGNCGTATFIAATDKEERYDIDLAEVVSCNASVLKDKQAVEGVLHNQKIFGICRTMDLYLESKLGASHKERPKLNLTVKKDRAGTIMAQSMMAKGPDGTNGFTTGWTTRKSHYTSDGDS